MTSATPMTSATMTMMRDRRGTVLVALCLGVLIAALDTSVVNLAVRRIGAELHVGVSALQWVLDAYNLFYAMLLLTGGALGDLYGRRLIYLSGLAIFVLGSLLCGLAPDAALLIAGRAITGIGAAMLLPCSLALVTVVWPERRERARVLGLWAGCNGLAMAIGPTVGGLLIDRLGWRSIFLLVVPLALAAIALTLRAVPESASREGRHLDLRGQGLAAAALGALALAAIEGPRWGWSSPSALTVGVVCVIAGILFLWAERRAGAGAMMPLDLFRNRVFSGAFGIAACMTFGMYGMLFLLPFDLQRVAGLSPTGAGLAIMPMSLVFVLVSGRSGAWAARFGARAMTIAGMALMGLGLLAIVPVATTLPLPWVIAATLVVGVGLGLNTGPLMTVAVGTVAKDRAGTASALINTARMVGATLGVAIIGAIYASGPATRLGAALATGAGVELAGAMLAAVTIRTDALK